MSPRFLWRRCLARPAFTVLELLMVVVILGLIAGLVMVKIADSKTKTGIAAMKNDLHAFATAAELEADNTGGYPSNPTTLAGFSYSPRVRPVAYQAAGGGWTLILAYDGVGPMCSLRTAPGVAGSGRISCSTSESLPFLVSDGAPSFGAPVTFDASGAIGTIALSPAPTTFWAIPQLWAVTLDSTATIAWDFGDGTHLMGLARDLETVTYTSKSQGTLTVRVALVLGDGRIFSGSSELAVGSPAAPVVETPYRAAPVPVITITPAEPETFRPTVVDARRSTADGGIASITWGFGEGGLPASNQMVDTVQFQTSGAHVISLTVTDNGGLAVTVVKGAVVAQTNQTPVARMAALSGTWRRGQSLTVDASSSSDADGTIVETRIDAGDGTAVRVGSSATFSYATVGTYALTVTVVDNQGATNSFTQSITVVANDAPTVATIAISGTYTAGLPLTFTVSAADPNGDHVSKTWDFGDFSAPTAGDTVSHTYSTTPATFQVQVTAADAYGLTATAVTSVTTVAPAISLTNFQVASRSGEANTQGETVTFAASASIPVGTIANYAWTFGDSATVYNTATGTSPAHTYNVAGTYKVKLTVTSAAGEAKTDSLTELVWAAGVSGGTLSQEPNNIVAYGSPVTYTVSGMSAVNGSLTGYSWDFGDGTGEQSSGATPSLTHTFTAAGTDTVRVRITNSWGNTKDVTMTTFVVAPSLATMGLVTDGLVAALDASDVSMGNTKWVDVSGNGRHCTTGAYANIGYNWLNIAGGRSSGYIQWGASASYVDYFNCPGISSAWSWGDLSNLTVMFAVASPEWYGYPLLQEKEGSTNPEYNYNNLLQGVRRNYNDNGQLGADFPQGTSYGGWLSPVPIIMPTRSIGGGTGDVPGVFTVTKSGTTVTAYQDATTTIGSTTFFTRSVAANNRNLVIPSGGSGYTSTGLSTHGLRMGYVLFYSRTLTSAEILQNYRAIRSISLAKGYVWKDMPVR